jgi:hypothetical protein
MFTYVIHALKIKIKGLHYWATIFAWSNILLDTQFVSRNFCRITYSVAEHGGEFFVKPVTALLLLNIGNSATLKPDNFIESTIKFDSEASGATGVGGEGGKCWISTEVGGERGKSWISTGAGYQLE